MINAGGVLFTDISTAAFADNIDPAKMITIGIDYTQVDGRIYSNVRMRDMFVELTAKVKKFTDVKLQRPAQAKVVGGPDDPITQESLAGRYQRFLKPNDIVVAETGTTSTVVGGLLLPEGAVYHNQTLVGLYRLGHRHRLGNGGRRPVSSHRADHRRGFAPANRQ